MRSHEDAGPTTGLGALLLVLVTVALAGASLLAPGTIARFSAYIWGAIVVLTLAVFRGSMKQGFLYFIQAGSCVVGIGLSLNDFNLVPFGLFGGVIWGAVLIASFLFGLIYLSQYVLPLAGSEGWSEGLRLLGRHYLLGSPTPQPVDHRRAGRSIRRARTENSERDPNALPNSFRMLNAGILKSHQILALTKGSGFSRPVGPGFVTLFGGERIASQFDLRNHVRTQSVAANTRDGIPVETSITLAFRIRHTEPADNDPNLQHPYDKDAVFSVTYASSIGEQDELMPWTERLGPQAAAILTAELARYELNGLYQPDDDGIAGIDLIGQAMNQQLTVIANNDGIELLYVGFDHFTLPEAVTEQRIKTWQADWERKILERQATGNAEALRRMKQARAQTQIKIIKNITQNIRDMRETGDLDLTEIITLRTIEALESALSDESVQMLIPRQVLSHLVSSSASNLHTLTESSSQEDEDG